MRLILITLLVGLSVVLQGQEYSLDFEHGACYPQLNNRLRLVTQDGSCSHVRLAVDKGEIEDITDCQYRLRTDRDGRVLLSVFAIDDGALLEQLEIRVVPWPAPTVYFGSSRSHEREMSLGEAKAHLGIFAPIEQFDICGRFEILDFRFTLIRNGDLVLQHRNTGGRFDEVIREQQTNLKAGDQLRFDQIRVKMPGQSLPGEAATFNVLVR